MSIPDTSNDDPMQAVTDEITRIDNLCGLKRAEAFVQAYEAKGHKFLLLPNGKATHQAPKGWSDDNDIGYATYFKKNHRDELIKFLESRKISTQIAQMSLEGLTA